MVVMVHAISWLPRWTVYEPLANWRMNGFKTWDASECRKFSQTSTSLLFFCTSAFFVGRILLPKEWLFSRQGWDGLSHSEVIDADFKFYYLLYMARFLSDLISIFFEDRKRVRLCPRVILRSCCLFVRNESINHMHVFSFDHGLFMYGPILGRFCGSLYPSFGHTRFSDWIGPYRTLWLWWRDHVFL